MAATKELIQQAVNLLKDGPLPHNSAITPLLQALKNEEKKEAANED